MKGGEAVGQPEISVKTLAEVRDQLAKGAFDFTRHAFRRAAERNISDVEIQHAGAAAEVIEDYSDDKYSPSVLLLGFTHHQGPLHLQVSLFPSPRVRIITLV